MGGAPGEELSAAPHLREFSSGRVGLGPRPHGALTSPAAPRQKLDLERETIELVHTEPTDVAQLPSRVPRDAARYHFFLYKHTHEGDPLESVGEWPWWAFHCSRGCIGAARAHSRAGRLRGLWGRQERQARLILPPRLRSVHLLHARLQVQHQGAHALLQLQEPPPRLRGAGLPAGGRQEGGCCPLGPCHHPYVGRQHPETVAEQGALLPCWMEGETEAQGVVCVASGLDKPQL